jgi:secreted trypsin-like serine protease
VHTVLYSKTCFRYTNSFQCACVQRSKERDFFVNVNFSFQCGVSSAYLPKLVGGKNAELNEIPWQAHLQIQHHDIQDIQYCGGVLVHEQVVLTAAHCVAGVSQTSALLLYTVLLLYRQKYRPIKVQSHKILNIL